MARRQQPLSERRQIDQRETFRYRPQTGAVARPSGEIRATPAGERLRQLSQALQQGMGTMGQMAQYREQEQARLEAEGYQAGLIGDELPEDSPEAKIAGFMKAQGQGDVYDFNLDLQQYYQENWQQSPDEFREGLTAIMDEYIAEQTPEYLEGFLPNARQTEHKIVSEYLNAQHQQMRQDGLNNIGKSFMHEVLEIHEQTDDPEEQAKLYRKSLTDLQKQGKEFGLTRDEVSERVMSLMSQRAEQYGNPGLLDFFDVPDDDGVRLSWKYPEKDRTYKQRAVRAYDTIQGQFQERQEQHRKVMTEALQKDVIIRLRDIESNHVDISTEDAVAELIELRQSILTEYEEFLSPKDIDNYLTEINDLLDIQGFASKVSDQDFFVSMRDFIMDMDKPEDYQAYRELLSENRSKLTVEDYRELNRLATQERISLEDSEVTELKRYKADQWKYLQDVLSMSGQDLFSLSITKGPEQAQDEKRLMMAHRHLNSKWRALMADTGGKPTYQQVEKMIEEVRRDALRDFPPVDVLGTISNGEGGQRQGQQQQRLQQETEEDNSFESRFERLRR